MHCIAYPGGCYGNFVGWTLEWMQDKYPLDYRPFTEKNNSHNWNGNFRSNVDEAVLIPMERSHVHPIQHRTDNLIFNIEKLLTAYDKVILLYPALNDFVWHINNKQTKIFKDGWIKHNQSQLDMSNWEGDQLWELREYLSLYLYDQNKAEIGYNNVIDYTNDKVFKIQINQIRDSLPALFAELAGWLGILNVRTSDELTKLHTDWLQNEPYLYKDRLIENIVDAIINNKFLEMNGLSIVDESQVQHRLRIAGYEIECYGLNEWPSTTTQLRELVYKV